MTTSTNYTYSMAPTYRDEHGVKRGRFFVEITAEELAALNVGEFQGASDLPDETEFADGTDADGREIVVYRSANN